MAEAEKIIESTDEAIEDEASSDNLLSMSDEDFEKSIMEDFAEEAKEPDTTETEATADESDDDQEEEDDPTDTDEEEAELTDDSESEDTEEDDDTDDDDESESETEEEDTTEKETLSSDDQIKQIFEPFKANGKEMKVESVDDVRQLMQMGANYNKKMAGLKPNLKLLKMLQNNDLLDEGKLAYLIDLDKKNPNAIKKLVKDSKMDTDDLDNDEEINYKPNTYTVNDEEIELDATLDDIRETKSFATTLDIIGNKWDETSRNLILKAPSAIRILNDHVEAGIYDKVNAAVETERMFNRIPLGMSDLEAYKYVAEQINANGGLQDPNHGTPVTKTVSKQTKKVVDEKALKRRKAASSTKSSPKSKSKETFNPLAMSDEEFEKISMDKFI